MAIVIEATGGLLRITRTANFDFKRFDGSSNYLPVSKEGLDFHPDEAVEFFDPKKYGAAINQARKQMQDAKDKRIIELEAELAKLKGHVV